MSIKQFYDGGSIATDIHDDNSGFIYYPNGSVAVCISPVNDYQNCFYAFDTNRKMSMLLGFNEDAIGFCSSTKRKSADSISDTVVCLSHSGGLVSMNGSITKQWQWNGFSSSRTKANLTDDLTVQLNENLVFKFKDQDNMSINFQHSNISYKCDLGRKMKRNDSCYLDNAKREMGGKLIPQIDYISLKQRQKTFNESMLAQRNKIHPRSENLSDMVRSIVVDLENRFDGIESKMMTTPGIGTSWQAEALNNTLNEIPKIAIIGTETGSFSGFGKHMYVNREEFSLSNTLPAAFTSADGTWKGEVEIRHVLREHNPPLKRSEILRANSGRYSNMLIVSKTLVTADNPTGMTVSSAKPLETIRWKTFIEDVTLSKHVPTAPVYVALVLRPGDPACCASEYAAEVLNARMMDSDEGNKNTQTTSHHLKNVNQKYKMYKIDVCEDPGIVNELGIKHLPVFVMFHGGNMVYAGPIGGKKVKCSASSISPQVLVVEPDIRHQIGIEKTVRKQGCDTFLCLSVGEAIERIQQFSAPTSGRAPIIFDIIFLSDQLSTNDISTLAKKVSEFTSSKRTVLCGLVDVLGENGYQNLHAVKWKDCITEDVSLVLPATVSNFVSLATQKPIKSAAIVKLLSLRVVPPENMNFGLSPESLLAKMNEVIDKLQGTGNEMASSLIQLRDGKPYVGIRLSAEDVRMRGMQLTK